MFAPCGAGCSKHVEAADEWAANAVAAPTAAEKAADSVLGADDPDAGKSFQQILLEKKTKGVGTGERVLRTTERPAHMAKNRLNLPDELPLDWRAYAEHFPSNQPVSNQGGTQL